MFIRCPYPLLPIFRITPRSPNISVSLDHSKPALAEEYYEVSVNVRNMEATPITNVSIKLSIPLEEFQPEGELLLLLLLNY